MDDLFAQPNKNQKFRFHAPSFFLRARLGWLWGYPPIQNRAMVLASMVLPAAVGTAKFYAKRTRFSASCLRLQSFNC